MTRYTVFGKATKCPNCHAYLPAHAADARQLRCEYCGVEVEVEGPKRAPTGGEPEAVPVAIRSPDPTQLVRAPKVRTWPYFLMAPLMTGGILYYSYFMQREAMDRSQQIAESAQTHASDLQREAQARASAVIPDPGKVVELAGPVAMKGPTCQVSPGELQETVEAKRKVVAACFEDAPKKVKKVEADLTLVVEPNGAVSDVDIDWDGWKPAPKMRKCAARKIRAWKLARPSEGQATKCQVHLSVDPR